MPNTIYVSNGAQQYVTVTLTERTGQDISTTTTQLSLGTFTSPSDTWITPEVVSSGDSSVIIVKLLLTDSIALDTYYIWAKITDTAEVTIIRCAQDSQDAIRLS